MSAHAGDKALRIERSFRAPAQKVFEAWTSPEVMRRWWQAEQGWETSAAAVDLRVGGEVHVVMRDPAAGEEYGGGGAYTEIDPPSRLAFTWHWDGESRQSLIVIDFEETAGAPPSASRTAGWRTRRPCARTSAAGATCSTTSRGPWSASGRKRVGPRHDA